KVLTKDGYQLSAYTEAFDDASLAQVDILVISNALAQEAMAPFVTPTPSAFTEAEIAAVERWVASGGSLLLIADHMPFAGASASLAEAFGVAFYDGFLLNADSSGLVDFSRANGKLADHVLLAAEQQDAAVDFVRSFTGQAFTLPDGAISLLNPTDEQTLYLTDTMWVFHPETPTMSGEGLSQGAIMPYGSGRLAVFGEAAMFTGQLAGPTQFPVGMNSPNAPQNYRFLLRIIHWLDGDNP
ncbi:MAG: DUF4350 domain-containing protein, partial [Bacteroidota bacterium]